jgi:hypothetical protein
MRGAGMTLSQLITMLSNRLAALNNAHATAASLGNVDDAARLNAEIEITQTTLGQLRSIQ